MCFCFCFLLSLLPHSGNGKTGLDPRQVASSSHGAGRKTNIQSHLRCTDGQITWAFLSTVNANMYAHWTINSGIALALTWICRPIIFWWFSSSFDDLFPLWPVEHVTAWDHLMWRLQQSQPLPFVLSPWGWWWHFWWRKPSSFHRTPKAMSRRGEGSNCTWMSLCLKLLSRNQSRPKTGGDGEKKRIKPSTYGTKQSVLNKRHFCVYSRPAKSNKYPVNWNFPLGEWNLLLHLCESNTLRPSSSSSWCL